MALKQDYPDDFEMIWQAYPSWPKGRSVKQASFRKFQTLKKQLGWNQADVRDLVKEIERQRERRASWQPGSKFGPQGLQVWLNQHGWEHEYETTEEIRKQERSKSRRQATEPWEVRGISKAEWEAEQDWLAREQMKLPQSYNTLEQAMAAARLQEMANGQRH